MRGHTFGYMSFSVGIIHVKSSKHNLNTKIAMESELVSFSEYVPYKIHMINIFLGQGHAL